MDFKKKPSILLITASYSQNICLLKQFELTAFFCSYLKNSVQRVFIRGCYSSEGTVNYVVPQGLVLGPVLFCIYINDLPLHISSDSAECHILVDDTTLYTSGKKIIVQIQKTQKLCLDRISVWCNANHMLINPVKTKSMVITTRQMHQLSDLPLRLSVDGQNIENLTEHRLLDLIVDDRFRWQAQIEHIIMQKHVNKTNKQTVSSFSTATYHQHRHHRLRVSSVGRLWRSTLKKREELPTSDGRRINPS